MCVVVFTFIEHLHRGDTHCEAILKCELSAAIMFNEHDM